MKGQILRIDMLNDHIMGLFLESAPGAHEKALNLLGHSLTPK